MVLLLLFVNLCTCSNGIHHTTQLVEPNSSVLLSVSSGSTVAVPHIARGGFRKSELNIVVSLLNTHDHLIQPHTRLVALLRKFRQLLQRLLCRLNSKHLGCVDRAKRFRLRNGQETLVQRLVWFGNFSQVVGFYGWPVQWEQFVHHAREFRQVLCLSLSC